MRTNEYTLPQFARAIDSFVAAGGDRAIADAVFGVKAEYLEASLDEMQKHYGTIENYSPCRRTEDPARSFPVERIAFGRNEPCKADATLS
jgi:hypothetical protein